MNRRQLFSWLTAAAWAPAAGGAPADRQLLLLPPADADLQSRLEAALAGQGWTELTASQQLAVSCLDLSSDTARYAGVNDRLPFYAASLPKIGVMLGVFEAVKRGVLPYTRAVEGMLERTIRLSSNPDASRLIQNVGFAAIARALESYGLYDPGLSGGLWVGKAYGPSGMRGHVESWRADPISGQWHAANCLQVTRFFWLLERRELVTARFSREMKRILGNPGTREFFVEGLAALGVPLSSIFRKYGAYADQSCDAALVDHAAKRYVAVAWIAGGRGATTLPRLIQVVDELVAPAG